ncbi:hypothetical protein D3C75_1094630 [compost metagenome]
MEYPREVARCIPARITGQRRGQGTDLCWGVASKVRSRHKHRAANSTHSFFVKRLCDFLKTLSILGCVALRVGTGNLLVLLLPNIQATFGQCLQHRREPVAILKNLLDTRLTTLPTAETKMKALL